MGKYIPSSLGRPPENRTPSPAGLALFRRSSHRRVHYCQVRIPLDLLPDRNCTPAPARGAQFLAPEASSLSLQLLQSNERRSLLLLMAEKARSAKCGTSSRRMSR
ncbi:hypothetical protein DPV79_27645 [Burkholderia reimsis]|uniref:Uncharacterized protein n=1 Tax=Burkholderia reimsis TaxID=2234132 RepID=A0A365QP35_9BURK|nr:hypothetical protein DPV79_27645 [Burkholderia reimsis]